MLKHVRLMFATEWSYLRTRRQGERDGSGSSVRQTQPG